MNVGIAAAAGIFALFLGQTQTQNNKTDRDGHPQSGPTPKDSKKVPPPAKAKPQPGSNKPPVDPKNQPGQGHEGLRNMVRVTLERPISLLGPAPRLVLTDRILPVEIIVLEQNKPTQILFGGVGELKPLPPGIVVTDDQKLTISLGSELVTRLLTNGEKRVRLEFGKDTPKEFAFFVVHEEVKVR